jgi:hypothetical protein
VAVIVLSLYFVWSCWWVSVWFVDCLGFVGRCVLFFFSVCFVCDVFVFVVYKLFMVLSSNILDLVLVVRFICVFCKYCL